MLTYDKFHIEIVPHSIMPYYVLQKSVVAVAALVWHTKGRYQKNFNFFAPLFKDLDLFQMHLFLPLDMRKKFNRGYKEYVVYMHEHPKRDTSS